MSGLFSSVNGMISSLSSTLTSSFSGAVNIQDDFMLLTTFYQAYRECKSAHEISTLVTNHGKYLKWLLTSTRLTSAQTCEVLERCLICKTLGIDVSFAAIHAIQLAQSSQIWEHKRTAYLTCCELMDEHSDMAILMVSTIQQDLRSRHVPTVCLALSTATVIISSELMPSIDSVLSEKFNHQVPLVRQRAVVCLGAFIRRNTEIVQSKLPYLKAMLLDKDPSVMATSLQVIDSLPSEHIFSSDTLFKPLCFILNQFLSGNAPKKFIKKGVCGSHVVVRLIRVLGKLDKSKAEWNQKLILSMLSVIDKYESTLSNPAVMMMKECSSLLLRVSTDSKHCTRIANYARHLLKSDAMNYHYTSLAVFAEVIKQDKGQITPHQDLIVSALASRDATIAEKSILLIIELTNAENVQSVYELYSKICRSTSSGMQYGVNILTSCALSDISIEWFAQSLLKLLSAEQNRRVKRWTRGQQSVLNRVLTYISAESVKDSALDLFNCLDGLVKGDETCPLDIFTIMLWLKIEHESAFSKSDHSLVALLQTGCRRAKKPYTNVTTFLSAIRSLLIGAPTSIQDSDVAALRQLAAASNEEASCYIYIQDIKDMVSGAVKYETTTRTITLDSLLPELKQYKNDRMNSNMCRIDCLGAAVAEEKALKFTSETDSRITTASMAGSTQLVKAKEVWTAKGRRESTESRVPESPEVDDAAAPVEFSVEDGDDSTEKLTSHIFSSL